MASPRRGKKAADGEQEAQAVDVGSLMNQLVTAVEAIQKVAEGQALSDKQPDGIKDTKPATDPAGKVLAIADLIKMEYTAQMRTYTGAHLKARETMAQDVRAAIAEMRQHLTKAYIAARTAVLLAREAESVRMAQAQQYAIANAPKLVVRLTKAQEAARRAQRKVADLEAQQAAAPRGTRATA